MVRKFKIPILCQRGHLMDYPLPKVDNHGQLTNYHLPHFVHVVIEQPLLEKINKNYDRKKLFGYHDALKIYWAPYSESAILELTRTSL